jgi:DNA-directed RNA polymerase subunit beta'
MKENVICGHLIPAGTGLKEYEKIVVCNKADYEKMQAASGRPRAFSAMAMVEED